MGLVSASLAPFLPSSLTPLSAPILGPSRAGLIPALPCGEGEEEDEEGGGRCRGGR